MTGRETQEQGDIGVDVETSLDDEPTQASQDSSGGIGSAIGKAVQSVISVRALGIGLVLSVVGVVAFGALPLVGVVGKLLGLVAAGFLYGLLNDDPNYLEVGLAGAIVGGGTAFLGNILSTFLGPGLPIVVVGLVVGAVASAGGQYLGRDLRDGVTRDL